MWGLVLSSFFLRIDCAFVPDPRHGSLSGVRMCDIKLRVLFFYPNAYILPNTIMVEILFSLAATQAVWLSSNPHTYTPGASKALCKNNLNPFTTPTAKKIANSPAYPYTLVSTVDRFRSALGNVRHQHSPQLPHRNDQLLHQHYSLGQPVHGEISLACSPSATSWAIT